jgi:hypothetical protein
MRTGLSSGAARNLQHRLPTTTTDLARRGHVAGPSSIIWRMTGELLIRA